VRTSAGILLFRRREPGVEVLLAHMGGPFWQRRDAGAWSIPKGEYAEGEDALAVACREFEEELGSPVPSTQVVELGSLRQSGGKHVTAWAAEGEFDVTAAVSNTFELEWPKGSGRMQEFAEVDRAEWFDLPTARVKILASQVPFLDRLVEVLGQSS
jgi:predicted NUDIX family NTP pyrophosphohydrolase